MFDWVSDIFQDNSSLSPILPIAKLNSSLSNSGLSGHGLKSRRQTSGNTVGRLTTGNGVIVLAWDDGQSFHYNLTLDLSSCKYGIARDEPIGIYTLANGTTQQNATFEDIVVDLYTIWRPGTGPRPNPKSNPFSGHTFDNAQLALDEVNSLFNELVCTNTTNSTLKADTADKELRKLLVNAYEYYTGVILGATIGAGVGVGIACAADVLFEPHHVTGHNVFQTGLLGTAAGMIQGIFRRQADIGRLSAATTVANGITNGAQTTFNAAQGTVQAGQAAVVEQTFIARIRRFVGELRNQWQRSRDTGRPQNPLGSSEDGDNVEDVADRGQAHGPGDAPNLTESEDYQDSTMDAGHCVPPEDVRSAMLSLNDRLTGRANILAQVTEEAEALGRNQPLGDQETVDLNQIIVADAGIARVNAEVANPQCG